MTAAESQQLGELLTEVKHLRETVDEVKTCQQNASNKIEAIELTIAGFSGGKKALLWLGRVIYLGIGVVIAYLALKKD